MQFDMQMRLERSAFQIKIRLANGINAASTRDQHAENSQSSSLSHHEKSRGSESISKAYRQSHCTRPDRAFACTGTTPVIFPLSWLLHWQIVDFYSVHTAKILHKIQAIGSGREHGVREYVAHIKHLRRHACAWYMHRSVARMRLLSHTRHRLLNNSRNRIPY